MSLSVLPQQLGEFESLSFNHIHHRQVKLYNYVSKEEKWIPYEMAWEFQKQLLNAQLDRIQSDVKQKEISNIEDAFLKSTQFLTLMDPNDVSTIGNDSFQGDSVVMLQHNPVYTLGTASDPSFIKDSNGTNNHVDIVRIDRGGEVTYHGPGQLVVYPVIDLRGYKQDIHWYIRALEEAIILALKSVGIQNATREDDITGVWVEGKKIAAIGVKVRRWVTMHGLAVNVDKRSLANFDGIVPCGLERDVGCINDILLSQQMESITIDQFSVHMKQALENVFQMTLLPASHDEHDNFL